MRTGPFGRRDAHTARFIEGSLCCFQRPPCGEPVERERLFRHRARAAGIRRPLRERLPNSLPAQFKFALPINLREFLAEQLDVPLSEALRIDEDGVFTLDGEAGEGALSRVARAIRRYSTQRAHERWEECASVLQRLTDELEWAHNSGEQLVLCLGCATLELSGDAVARHRRRGCVAVELSATTACPIEESQGLPEMLRHVIEGFRLGRAALGLTHYDLDCYVARGQVIFTWRPLTK
ncbi:MAG TPA: hypothetical protein VKT27_12675 [Candidatus Binataceae bacterium]|nr:hypothetical protein [Candidatus Binataceae bacterium]